MRASLVVGLVTLALAASLGGCARRLESLIDYSSRENCPSARNAYAFACEAEQQQLGPETIARAERNLFRWITRRYGGTELTAAQLFDLASELYAPCPAPREPRAWSCRARLRIEARPAGFLIMGDDRTVLVDFLAVPKDGRWQVTQATITVPGRATGANP